ncbi:carbohydrate ABC transporter permease [Aestuariimicrobium sp. p3-SID1156]|uniref:carbohydrate ABC transporter permease n=1 Tax=Aestuariimicrobium sp. p3-SID1156 TaxID=2916038 RepID=UPI00223B94F1|nr:carbohydrate ABC transporter permease [Aestuariimicrobium sp. p3-SID1156]MCT1460343.1 carbohydrate ABC transporter permease [Aestuariimicrobium sp. p3-SID1156]
MNSAAAIEQLAGKGAARAARRRLRGGGGVEGRPSPWNYVLLSAFILLSAYPLYFALLLASSDAGHIARNPIPSLIPRGNLLENLTRVLESDIQFWPAFWNSVIVAVITSVSVVFFATLAGFAFSKLQFRGRRFLLGFIIATMAVPTQLGVIPMFLVMSKLDWVGDLKAVIVPGLVTAFGVFWMTQYLEEALPFELVEAARVDGCSMLETFWHVAFPAARGAAAMLFLFTFVGSWTNFFWPFIILGSDNPTLPVALQLLQASYFKDYSLIMAGVVVSVIPLLLLFIVAGRQLVSGIMQGAVKG